MTVDTCKKLLCEVVIVLSHLQSGSKASSETTDKSYSSVFSRASNYRLSFLVVSTTGHLKPLSSHTNSSYPQIISILGRLLGLKCAFYVTLQREDQKEKQRDAHKFHFDAM